MPSTANASIIGEVIPEPHVTVTHVGPVFRVERIRLDPPSAALGTGSADACSAPQFCASQPLVKDVVRHPGAVTVVAVRDDGRLVFVRNRRIAVGATLLEFCAGKLEPGEEPAAAAARELEEETGYQATTIRALGTFFTSPGFTDEKMYVFEARGLRPVPQRLEPGEEIEVAVLDVAEFERLISAGLVEDGKSLGAYLLWRARAELRDGRSRDGAGILAQQGGDR